MTATILDQIVATKHEEVARARQVSPLADWIVELAALPPCRDFAGALSGSAGSAGAGRKSGAVKLIAEIKKASPSRGVIRADFDPPALARAYEKGGASALSVLTDGPYFQGSLEFLQAVRKAVPLPLLRKDFTIDTYQIYEARYAGADAVLLIAAILDDAQLEDFRSLAEGLGMAALVEVHTADEMARAVDSGARIIGINNRDLATFETDLGTTEKLLPGLPNDIIRVSESGIFEPSDVTDLGALGVHAVLVGESLMREPDVAAATRTLLGGVTL